MDFDEWWNNYKHKIPGPKRNSVKHWAKVGWDAHIFELEQERLREEQYHKDLVDEFQRLGCPPGFWGDFS